MIKLIIVLAEHWMWLLCYDNCAKVSNNPDLSNLIGCNIEERNKSLSVSVYLQGIVTTTADIQT